jgi:hypothetical protein
LNLNVRFASLNGNCKATINHSPRPTLIDEKLAELACADQAVGWLQVALLSCGELGLAAGLPRGARNRFPR